MTYEKIFECCEKPRVATDYPTMEALSRLSTEEDALRQFLAWLQERGLFLARYVPKTGAIIGDTTEPQRLILEFFGLNWNLYQSEHYAMREKYKDVYEFWEGKFQEAEDRARMVQHAAQVQKDIETRARMREVTPLFRAAVPE
jgi:hypothetical protein